MSIFPRGWRSVLMAWLVLGVLAAAAGPAAGATNAAGPALSPPAAGQSLAAGMAVGDIMRAGGWLMWVLAGMSIAAVALILYLFAILRTNEIAPPDLLREVVGRLEDGALDDARMVCEDRRCALASVVLSAVDHLRGAPDADPALLKDIMVSEGSRQAEDIQGQTQYLLDIAVISPMVGLLGTVFGMLHAFGAVAHDIASAKPVVLAEGVSMALLTTAFGLLVGIPSMMFYAYFRRRASKQILFLETAASDVLTAVTSKGGGRARIAEIKDQLRKA
jgi:biopolymer transport protein ExbB